MLDLGPVQELLFQGVGVPDSDHGDVAGGERGVEAAFQAEALEAEARGDCHRHPAEHAAEGGLGGVVVAVGVDPDEADPEGSGGWARALEACEHPHEGVAVGEEAQGEEAAAPLVGDDVGEVAGGEAEPVPRPVLSFLIGGEGCRSGLGDLAAELLEESVEASLLHGVWALMELGGGSGSSL